MSRDPRQLAATLLRGSGRLPKLKPDRVALAQNLPLLAEDLRCARDEEDLATAPRGLERLWELLEPDELEASETGTAQLVAGCMEAADVLGIELAPLMRNSSHLGAAHRALVERPRVFVPLVGDAPARVFQSSRPVGTPAEDPAIRETGELIQRMLGTPAPHQLLDRPAKGHSKMAALFIRAVLELWPQKRQVLSSWRTAPVPLGFTGALDSEGIALPIEGLEEKVLGFFQKHPTGRLFVPASQWREARRIADSRKRQSTPKWYEKIEREERTWRVQPFRSALDLLVRLGITTEAHPETRLFEKLRGCSTRVTLWNNEVVPIWRTVPPAYERARKQGPEEPETLGERSVLEELYENWLSGRTRTLFIEGGPGSGKSIALHRLAARWYLESHLLGPAIRVNARELSLVQLDLDRALALASRSTLDVEECRQLVAHARSKSLEGGIWLLVDGLDEVSALERRRIRELVDAWPGPTIIGARPLPNEASDHPHLRIQSLGPQQQRELFQLLDKEEHWKALTGGDEPKDIRVDRRKVMVADLCSTPLGVSLLAEFPETALGVELNVQEVLRGGLTILLERAEAAGRISGDVRRRVIRNGLPVLGRAAWSMIRRGEATLRPDDLERMGRSRLADSVHEILEKSDLVQRVGPMSYQFSHKSLAELCAAMHLCSRPGTERELLERMGNPGAEAVAFHFGAHAERERLGSFLRALADNPHRPMSSLALATRLLGANGPERTEVAVALDILVRRVRLASWFGGRGDSIPGGLDETEELWRALARWSEALRAHAPQLIAACAPTVRQFLDGQLPPLPPPSYPGLGRPSEDLHGACDFAERLALTLGLEQSLPPRVVARFKKGRELLEKRPKGPWLSELEPLFDMPEDSGRATPAVTAAAVWALKASPERRLQRLEVLSMFAPGDMTPVLETVTERGTRDERREALLRAALSSLEHANEEESPTETDLRKARHYARMSREKLLRRWDVLWARGLVGRTSKPKPRELEPLHATFLDDESGPARWRALIALGAEAVTPSTLRDPFPAVRVQALRLLWLSTFLGSTPRTELVEESIHSDLDEERWVALSLRGWDRTLPLEALLRALERRSTRGEEGSGKKQASIPLSPPWLHTLWIQGEEARQVLLRSGWDYLRNEAGRQAFFTLLETDLGPVAEELGGMLEEKEVPPDMLVHGSLRQRRIAAQVLWKRYELLAPYVNDPDPEIARLARNAAYRLDGQKRMEAHKKINEEARRQDEAQRLEEERRPWLKPDRLERFMDFEELWKALPNFKIGLQEGSLEEARQRQHQRARMRQAEDTLLPEKPSGSISILALHEFQPLTRRLSVLYEPRHRALLFEGLEDKELAPFAACVLREHLPIPELIPRVLDGGNTVDWAAEILEGTPHAREAATLLQSELLAGRLDAVFSGWFKHGSVRMDQQGQMLWNPVERLHQLDGLVALLPVLEAGAPEWLRREARNTVLAKWEELEPSASGRPEAVSWARHMEHSGDAELRVIARRILVSRGEPADAERWRPVLFRDEADESLLVCAIHIVCRFAHGPDMERLRTLVFHSPRVGSEAVVALTQAGGAAMLEELVSLLESPPEGLRQAAHGHADWRGAIAEMVLRLGDGEQARRVARQLPRSETLWRLAARHFRFPEHLLFMVARLGELDPQEERDQGHGVVSDLLEKAISRVGKTAAYRTILEAAFWDIPESTPFEYVFRLGARELLEEVEKLDEEVLQEALRKKPDDTLAIGWLGRTPRGEELLDRIWRTQAVPWWPANLAGHQRL